MGNINDFFFQILIALLGVAFGILPVVFPNNGREFKGLLTFASYAAVAIACFWAGIVFNDTRQQLQYYVSNQLAQSIHVFANGDEYQGIVEPGKTRSFSRLSARDFPLTVRWEIKKIRSFGDEMGETIRRVDRGQTITVDNQVGQSTYFHPMISSTLDQQCRISINDATKNEAQAGYINAHSENVTPGYFLWRDDSNVTLYCDNRPMWHGIRNGDDSRRFPSVPTRESGVLKIHFIPPDPSP